MITATLTRTRMGKTGTFGRLFITGGPSFATAELPWKDNLPMVSCIPAGTYLCRWTFSNSFKRWMYQIVDVTGRTGVRFHVGNWAGDKALGLKCDVEGCVLLGVAHGSPEGQEGVISSGGENGAVAQFERYMNKADFHLTIVDQWLEAGAPAGGRRA